MPTRRRPQCTNCCFCVAVCILNRRGPSRVTFTRRPWAVARIRTADFRGRSGLHGKKGVAYSGGRRNALVFGEELSELLAGGVVAEPFAGAVVEFGGDGVEL